MLMEETAAQYIIAQECDKYTVGRLEDRHYSFSFKKGLHFTFDIKSLLERQNLW